MRQFAKIFKRFRDDDTGSLTVEFIMIMPVLVTWFIGSIVFFNAFITKSAAQRAAFTVSDVLSRQLEIDNGFIDNLLVLQNRMLPNARVGTVTVSSIQKDAATGDLNLLWTYSTDLNREPLKLSDLPPGTLPFMQNGESVLLVDTTVPYVPLADWVGLVATDWENRVVVTSRFVDPLTNTDFP